MALNTLNRRGKVCLFLAYVANYSGFAKIGQSRRVLSSQHMLNHQQV